VETEISLRAHVLRKGLHFTTFTYKPYVKISVEINIKIYQYR